ncbi:MAG TPA: DNA translocase FtsK 4TM domain-containing protein, partial [Verrucomicrobiae bacterium]
MSRKTRSDSNKGFGDVIGIALLAAALLLFVAQMSFDPHDLKGLNLPLNRSTHNWIGPLGAYLAWWIFLPFGLVAYLIPPLLALFGAAYLLDFLSYLRERIRWSLLWSVMLVISSTGLLYVFDPGSPSHDRLHEMLGTWSAGGGLGWLTYGQTQNRNFGFSLLGQLGATIVYSALALISLLFLTNFQLGEWIRALFDKEPAAADAEEKSPEEIALERRARDLEKQAKKLQEEVARSGLG